MTLHRYRIAAFLAGCLILGSLFMIFVATGNFGTVDRILAAPPQQASQMFQTLGADNARVLLRYAAGQENQLFFTSWELAEIGLGVLLTAVLLLSIKSRLMAGMTGVMVIIALFQHFQVTPAMINLGRQIEFGSSGSAAESQFYRLHGLYGVLEILKLVLLVVVSIILLFGRRAKSAEPVVDANPVESTFAEP